jgi:hypothetical protein
VYDEKLIFFWHMARSLIYAATPLPLAAQILNTAQGGRTP